MNIDSLKVKRQLSFDEALEYVKFVVTRSFEVTENNTLYYSALKSMCAKKLGFLKFYCNYDEENNYTAYDTYAGLDIENKFLQRVNKVQYKELMDVINDQLDYELKLLMSDKELCRSTLSVRGDVND